MAKCDFCNKHRSFGRNVSHSKHRTPRDWEPNVQYRRLTLGGVRRRVHICTRCLRTMSRSGIL
jgi:large subunit ribosomal protein L28